MNFAPFRSRWTALLIAFAVLFLVADMFESQQEDASSDRATGSILAGIGSGAKPVLVEDSLPPVAERSSQAPMVIDDLPPAEGGAESGFTPDEELLAPGDDGDSWSGPREEMPDVPAMQAGVRDDRPFADPEE